MNSAPGTPDDAHHSWYAFIGKQGGGLGVVGLQLLTSALLHHILSKDVELLCYELYTTCEHHQWQALTPTHAKNLTKASIQWQKRIRLTPHILLIQPSKRPEKKKKLSHLTVSKRHGSPEPGLVIWKIGSNPTSWVAQNIGPEKPIPFIPFIIGLGFRLPEKPVLSHTK